VIYILAAGPACDCISTRFLYDCEDFLVKSIADSPDDKVDAQENLGPFVKIYSCKPER